MISTGFKSLDKILDGGFQEGTLAVIAAEPSEGKTGFGLTLLHNAAKTNTPVYLSLEFSKDQLFERILAVDSGIDLKEISSANLTDKEKKLIEDVYSQIASLTVEALKFPSMNDVLTRINELKAIHNTDVVFIDYIDLINAEASLAEQELKQLAKETGLAIVALHQIPRNSLASQKDTQADVFIRLRRDRKASPDKVSLSICKGDTSEQQIELNYDQHTTRISEC